MIEQAVTVDLEARAQTRETSHSFIVQAPAGSGKTELLVRRLLKLLAEVDEPEQILAITFTLAATAEMRARVLTALREAWDPAKAEDDPELTALARAALKHDAALGWNIMQQPQRLNIQTIDSVCLTIAHQTPLLSRLGGSLSPTDKPRPLYTSAARRTLARLGGDPEISDALRALLQLRSTRLLDCQNLIADMLDKRDQWGRVLPLTRAEIDWPGIRAALEKPLGQEHQRVFAKAHLLFEHHHEITRELIELLHHACGNVDPDAKLLTLRHVTQIRHLTHHEHWNCLCSFLLTNNNTWRKQANIEMGFIGGKPGKAAKDRYKSLIDDLDTRPEFLPMLCELRTLPPLAYSEEEWQMLRHMVVILRYATAELRLVFAERGLVDFVELGLAAQQVLRDDEGMLSEVAADVAAQWRHLLVDEFQDTSRSQYRLLTSLVEGWESSDPGTCFLVGDPMQSIYMFRQAEVELFERTRRHGLGEGSAALQLAPLQLQMNFRSHAGLVNRLNELFATIFGQGSGEDGNDYRVAFAPSMALLPAPRGNQGVRLWPFFRSSSATEEEKRAVEDAEARRVVSIIQEHWPTVLAKRYHGKFQIAVLVRAKSHLELITRKLRRAGIPFRALEIEQLSQRQEVMDLTALTRALLHPMDRIAWLTILRAPWCGLSVKDLHVLCGEDDKDFAASPIGVLLRERTSLLSEDGQVRATRVTAVLESALHGKHRQISLARWIERTWMTLGGRACVDDTGFENVRAFFGMLEDLGPEAGGLDERLAELCAQPDPEADEECGVQLMTIHKAKGLGFDVVIVPGLERVTRPDSQPLVRWLEQTRLIGKSEHEEQEFVVAPIGRNAEPGGIYEWIGEQQSRREDDEARRLLYVATTRARSELHLLGTATAKVTKEGAPELSPGNRHSLLGIAWEALKDGFLRAQEDEPSGEAAKPHQAEFAFAPLNPTLRWRRLPTDWKQPDRAPSSDDEGMKTQIVERPRGSLAARAFGTVVHALLEDLTRLPGIEDAAVSQTLLDEVGGWRARALALLRSTGLPRAEAEPQSAEVVRALLAVLRDPQARWLLGARAGAQTEVSWSTWASSEGAGNVVRTLRGDRVFRAGATPGSKEDTHLWIVDYKTTRHGTAGLEDFLAKEKQKYAQQLESYGDVLRKLPGNNLPLRLALYFPLLTKLVWW
jgi:ATP-dependent exoDNAse (exonuclease V) beta subunit